MLALLTLLPGSHIRMMRTGYPPFSLNDNAGPVAFYALIIHLLGAASLASAINLVVTNLSMRAPGITLKKTNLFLHAFLAMNVIQILGVPALAGAVTMLLLDKYFHTAFFDLTRGGDPILYPKHLLVLLSPSGICYDPTSLWPYIRAGSHFFKKGNLWKDIHDLCYMGNSHLGIHGLDTPHVYQRCARLDENPFLLHHGANRCAHLVCQPLTSEFTIPTLW